MLLQLEAVILCDLEQLAFVPPAYGVAAAGMGLLHITDHTGHFRNVVGELM